MNRFVSYFVVFVLGFAVCALTLQSIYGPKRGSTDIRTTSIDGRPGPAVTGKGDNQIAVAAAIIEKSVVNIDTVGRAVDTGYGFPFQSPQLTLPKGKASGVIISSNGYILTNNHVVEDVTKLTVTLWDNRSYEANIIGRDPKTDLAVIKIQAENLPAATFADETSLKTLRVGDWVIAVGNALGLGTTVTVGVVSATDRSQNIAGTVLEHAIQTDAPINRGNSGGALADINGNLVGINAAIASAGPDGGSIGIGFAIRADTARWVSEQLITKGRVVRPWLGIEYLLLDDNTRAESNMRGIKVPSENGAFIQRVAKGSPADFAGLKSGDLITKVNGVVVESTQSISDELKKLKVGDVIQLTVKRADGKTAKISVTTAEMPAMIGNR